MTFKAVHKSLSVRLWPRHKSKIAFCFMLSFYCCCGCQNDNSNELAEANQSNEWLQQIEQLTSERDVLTNRINLAEKENENLKNQLQTLSGLPENVQPEDVYNIKKVNIHRYTGFSDKNNDDEIFDTLIVYIQPIDEQGDVVKALGCVDVRLWNLNLPDGRAMLAQWHLTTEQLKQLWYNTMITTTFRLTFDISEIVTDFSQTYTIMVNFTNPLTGKIFEDQESIEPTE